MWQSVRYLTDSLYSLSLTIFNSQIRRAHPTYLSQFLFGMECIQVERKVRWLGLGNYSCLGLCRIFVIRTWNHHRLLLFVSPHYSVITSVRQALPSTKCKLKLCCIAMFNLQWLSPRSDFSPYHVYSKIFSQSRATERQWIQSGHDLTSDIVI